VLFLDQHCSGHRNKMLVNWQASLSHNALTGHVLATGAAPGFQIDSEPVLRQFVEAVLPQRACDPLLISGGHSAPPLLWRRACGTHGSVSWHCSDSRHLTISAQHWYWHLGMACGGEVLCFLDCSQHICDRRPLIIGGSCGLPPSISAAAPLMCRGCCRCCWCCLTPCPASPCCRAFCNPCVAEASLRPRRPTRFSDTLGRTCTPAASSKSAAAHTTGPNRLHDGATCVGASGRCLQTRIPDQQAGLATVRSRSKYLPCSG
jgi:hypothetical protein